MDRLDKQVRREMKRLGPADSDMAGIVRAWPAAVGETVARNAWPARIARDGTLHVNAASATWAFELGRMAAEILGQLRAEVGDATPAALRVAPGPIPEPMSEQATEAKSHGPRIASEDRAEAAQLASSIDDEELRELVVRAAAASLARARSDRGF
jgi:predicted nucleic acid-binding Zn ribbon protein